MTLLSKISSVLQSRFFFLHKTICARFFSIQNALYSLKSYFFKSKFGENSPVKENPDKAHYSQINLNTLYTLQSYFSGQNLAKICHKKKKP
jgi:hypothetical protein